MARVGSSGDPHVEPIGGQDPSGLVTAVQTDSSGKIEISTGAGNVPTVDAADGSTNATAPLFATQIGGQDGNGKLQALLVDNSGNLKVTSTGGGGGSNAAASATGSAVPADADFLGASDGTNLQGLLVESASHPNLRVSVFNGTSEMPAGDSSSHSIHTTVDNASIAVTGTFFQATQPVSGTVTATLSGSINNTGFNVTPATTGGLSGYHVVSAGNTNAANIKASAGQLYGWSIYSNATYPCYIKIFNKATAPTLGTDTPVMTLGIQAGTQREWSSDIGFALSAGLSIAITKGIADSDNTAVLASDCVVDLLYK